jgi:hypothetical protein
VRSKGGNEGFQCCHRVVEYRGQMDSNIFANLSSPRRLVHKASAPPLCHQPSTPSRLNLKWSPWLDVASPIILHVALLVFAVFQHLVCRCPTHAQALSCIFWKYDSPHRDGQSPFEGDGQSPFEGDSWLTVDVLQLFELGDKEKGRRQTMAILVPVILGCVPIWLIRRLTFNRNMMKKS